VAGLSTVTEFIATIDHNDGSYWGHAPVSGTSPFVNSSQFSNECTYKGPPNDTFWYICDSYVQAVPIPGRNQNQPPGTPANPLNQPNVTIVEDPICPPSICPPTLGNVRVARNFLHHNERDGGGYGVSPTRALIEGNTFSWNRHDISAAAEPHNEYRASNNLVLSGAPTYKSNPISIIGRLQDFDMHGTDNVNVLFLKNLYFGGAGGYYVEIDGNTFLGGDGHDYALRGFPIVNTSYQNNVSRRKENDAVKFIHCNPFGNSGCIDDYTGPPFPIDISNSQFGQTSQSPPDPTSTLGVGDFDGDGNDDLFLATGNSWFYSPSGQREWRFLNAAPDTIDQLLFGDFDGDGRTDVVGLRNGRLVVSWGGISAFEVLNANPLPCTSMSDMAVGDFDGDGHPDIFCADSMTWWISYGGNTPFVQVIVADRTRVKDLRFGDFNGDGTTDVFGVVNGAFASPRWHVQYGLKGFRESLTGWHPLPVSLTSTANGLVVADFDGNGIADVGMWCGSWGWQISYGGTQGWSNCNTVAPVGLLYPPTLANGAVGHFSGGPGADILLWNYSNSQGAATLWVAPGGTGVAHPLSSQDMH
jgi:hypothetical protein